MGILTRKTWFKWTLVLLWCGLIFYATESPSFTGDNTAKIIKQMTGKEQGTPVEKDLTGSHSEGISLNKLVRKGAHLSVFGILAILILLALPNMRRYRYVLAWLLVTLYGGFDEFHQSFKPGRTANIQDVGYDSLGAFMALLLYWGYSKRRNKR